MPDFHRLFLSKPVKFTELVLTCWWLPMAVPTQEWVNEAETRRSTRPDTILYLDLSDQQLKKAPDYVYRFMQLKMNSQRLSMVGEQLSVINNH